MKLHELLQDNSSVTFAHTKYEGLAGSFRFTEPRTKNDPHTYPVQIKTAGESWASFLWVDCRLTVDELIAVVEKEYPHLILEKSIKPTPKRKASRKKKQVKKYHIKNINPAVGEPTTTDKPLFEV